jgi:hypothetical protein
VDLDITEGEFKPQKYKKKFAKNICLHLVYVRYRNAQLKFFVTKRNIQLAGKCNISHFKGKHFEWRERKKEENDANLR